MTCGSFRPSLTLFAAGVTGFFARATGGVTTGTAALMLLAGVEGSGFCPLGSEEKPTRKETGSRMYHRGGSSGAAWALVGGGVTGREIGLLHERGKAGRSYPVTGNGVRRAGSG